jgi:ABC-type phosphonate transport system ATPase subunit
MFQVRNLTSAYVKARSCTAIDCRWGAGEIVALVGRQRHGKIDADEISDRGDADTLGQITDRRD